MIAVMGASGHTGKRIAEALLAVDEEVRVLGRTASRLAGLRASGAEVLTGDAADPVFLSRAFRGADAVYTLLPTDPRVHDYRAEQDRQGEAVAAAVRHVGVPHVVALSSLGADRAGGTGLIDGLHAQEERLRRLRGTNVLLLRPVSFYENFYDALGVIRWAGVNANSVDPELEIPMIATRDIAEVATNALRSRDWKGVVVRELLGPRDLGYPEATRILGQRIGRPDLEYVRLPDAEMARSLVDAGLSESFAGLYVEMTRAMNEGRVSPAHGRTRENTTPTPFEEFVDELAYAYEAAGRGEGPATLEIQR